MIELSEGQLVPVVVQDASDGSVLMVAYMNSDALKATRETGLMHFWSRSRNKLWKKGETSGNFQKVVEVLQDCDSDTLLAKVVPQGPACHTGRKSCFGDGAPGVLGEIETVLKERQIKSRAESYSSKLLGDEVLRLKKLIEEAGEVVLAAKGETSERLVSESADLIYHLMVVLRARGVEWREVLDELRRRRS